MSKLPSPDPRSLSGEVISESDPGSEVAAETDRFGFILANGTTASIGPPPELVRQREAKWINIISQWDHILQKKNKIKEQCQKGIPASLRAKCWPMLCGATERMKGNKDFYLSLDLGPALQSWVDVIERDLDRQFPFHEMFCSKDGHGQRGLFRVLKAYTQYQPDEGYCQAQGPVAAVLLMNMPAEEAFWCLVQISEQYLPGYYSQLLEGVLFDAAMLSWVLKKTCPQAHKHLQRYGVEPLMFATDWLMCMFTRHLPFDTLLRVWDLFFCHGVRVLFQVATVLVRRVLGRAEQRQECRGQMETLERLRGIRENLQQEGDASFVAEVCSVPLSRSDLKRRTEKELERWRKDRPMSTFDPRGRCHGYWASRGATQEEQDREDRVKGNLSVPLVRSASTVSLSPSLFRKQWGKGGGRIERHHSVGVRGVGREDWMEGREKCIPRVEEEDERKASGEIQNRMDRDSPHPTEVKGRVKMSRELRENQGIQKEALKESGGLKEREGIKQAEHRTLENQSEQRGTEKSQGDAPEVSQEARRNHSDEEESTVERVATQRPGAEQGPGNISQLLQPTSPTQPPSRRREEHNNTQSQVSDEQKQEEEVSKEHTTETPEEIGKLGTGSENLVASQTDVKTNDVETQAVLHTTREQTDTTADWETMTEDGEHIEEIHADTGTMTESDSAVKISKKESTAQQAPHVIIQTENSPTPHHKPTETASNASAETRETIEASVKATYHTETQEQASVDTQIQNNESIHLQMNTLSFQGTKKGANTVDNQREEINFVVSATTDPPAETTMGTEMVSDDRDAVSPSHLSETCSEKELALPEQAQAEKETILDTDAQPERDNDRRTSNQTLTKETPTETLEHSQATVLTGLDKECEASTEHIKLDPTAGTDGNMSSSSARASEAITTEKPGKQAVVSYVEERTENNEEKAVCNPNLPHQRHTVDSQSSAMVPHVQETCAGELFNPEMMHMVRQRTSTFSGDFCVRRSSGSHESRLARRLSENIFTALQSAFHSQSISSTKHLDQPKSTTTTTATGEPSNQPLVGLQGSTETTGMTGGAAPREEGLTLEQKPAEPPKRPGFFNRLRGGPPNPGKDRKASTHKIQVPKILIQDFSDGVVKECPLAAEVHHAKLSSRERRRRRRERERRAKEEEKMRRRREKELEKERKKPQTRGRSFQLRKDEVNKEDADPSSSVLKMAVDRYSAPYSDSYF